MTEAEQERVRVVEFLNRKARHLQHLAKPPEKGEFETVDSQLRRAAFLMESATIATVAECINRGDHLRMPK